jgi:ribosomal protein S18 acetylase RimI-like enzyme
VVKKPRLLQKLRELTLYPYSGLNKELDNLQNIIKQNKTVRAHVLTAFINDDLVGWALLSRETSQYFFPRGISFKEGDGALFEIYIDPKYRRLGIGTQLIRLARRKTSGDRLCIAPWDFTSYSFYDNFLNYNHKIL